MSGKSNKKLRRAIRKEADPIKINGLQQFFDYCNSQPFMGRLRYSIKIIFKRL